jgi:hypothetical protein
MDIWNIRLLTRIILKRLNGGRNSLLLWCQSMCLPLYSIATECVLSVKTPSQEKISFVVSHSFPFSYPMSLFSFRLLPPFPSFSLFLFFV